MQHLKVEQQAIGDVITNYFHDPEDQPQSMEDYFEDMLSQGYELVSFSFRDSTSNFVSVFRISAK